jgi:hypothetical protein
VAQQVIAKAPSDAAFVELILIVNGPGAGDQGVFSAVSVRELPGRHATQPTSGFRPIFREMNGKRRLEFDGVDDFMAAPYPNADLEIKFLSAVAVDRIGLGADQQVMTIQKQSYVWPSAVVANFFLSTEAEKYVAGMYIDWTAGTSYIDAVIFHESPPPGTPMVLSSHVDTEHICYFNDGFSTSSAQVGTTQSYTDLTTLYIGSTSFNNTHQGFAQMDLYGLIHISKHPTDAEVTTVRTYLQTLLPVDLTAQVQALFADGTPGVHVTTRTTCRAIWQGNNNDYGRYRQRPVHRCCARQEQKPRAWHSQDAMAGSWTTDGTGVSATGDTVTVTEANGLAAIDSGLEANKVYEIEITVSGMTGAGVVLSPGGTGLSPVFSTNGTHIGHEFWQSRGISSSTFCSTRAALPAPSGSTVSARCSATTPTRAPPVLARSSATWAACGTVGSSMVWMTIMIAPIAVDSSDASYCVQGLIGNDLCGIASPEYVWNHDVFFQDQGANMGVVTLAVRSGGQSVCVPMRLVDAAAFASCTSYTERLRKWRPVAWPSFPAHGLLKLASWVMHSVSSSAAGNAAAANPTSALVCRKRRRARWRPTAG